MRSSSFSNYDFCAQQYYLTYVLGLPRVSAKKADKGTIVHKVMEVLANCKRVMQPRGLVYDSHTKMFLSDRTKLELAGFAPINETYKYNDDQIGLIEWNIEDFLKPTLLTNSEIDDINKTRINKYNYKHDAKLKYGTIRYGADLVNSIIERAYNYYAGDDWAPVDKKDCTNWAWMALEYKDGICDPRRRTIVAAEPHFEFEIDKPWAKYAWNLPNGEKISGNLAIKGTIDLITQVGDGILEICDWKGLPLETKIPTPNGWTTMGELNIGDIVFDECGKQTSVIGKSEIKNKPCYRITFDDTSIVECDNEHLWKISTGEVKSVINLKRNDKIYITKPIDLEYKELPIDPYVLGIWLGDGRNRNSEVCGMDQFIFDEITKRGYTLGKDISSKNHCPQHTIFNLKGKLRKLNLLNNKHIPEIYLRSSYNQRLDLLRGLMDSDGNVNKARHQCIFTNCNQKLSQNVKELLLSLGQRPCLHHTINTQFGRDIDVYPISFRAIDINPFLLPRKANEVKPEWGHGHSYYRYIKKIELVENKLTQCIMVDSPSHTYLCTENMIPTHNTGQRLNWSSKKDNDVKTYTKLCDDFQLMLYHYAAKQLYPEAKQIIVSIFFIRDGGLFTICMDDSTIEKTEERIKKRFFEIVKCQQPAMLDVTQRHFKCTKLCDYYKMQSPDGSTNMCKFIHDKIVDVGIDEVTNLYTQEGFSIGQYQAPGEK